MAKLDVAESLTLSSRGFGKINMGYVAAVSPCFACGRPFSFNPIRVPSLRDSNNVRQPVCEDCINKVNPIREKKGLLPITYSADAYTCCDENELG